MLFCKRFLSVLTALAFVLSATVCAYAVDPPATGATSVCVMDADSGRVLYEKNAKEERCIASITKIMTALIALENADIKKVVTIPSAAAGVEGSSIYIKAGESILWRIYCTG